MSNSTDAARRTAVIAATSGLLITLGATGAEAHVRTTPAPKPAHTHGHTHHTHAKPAHTHAKPAHTHAKPAHTHAKPAHTHAPRASIRASRSAVRTGAAAQNLSASRADIMAVAAGYVGTPYRYGGMTPSGFDCSGFTGYVFAQVGVSLPRTSSAQASTGRRISRSEALPGDLVYKPGHIGIYAGNGMMYDSPRTGSTVSKRAIWSSDFVYIRVLNG